MPIYDFTIKAGATAPPLKGQIRNEHNSVVSITGAKGVRFSMRKAYPLLSVICNAKAASVYSAASGWIQYTWSTVDTSTYDDTEVEAEFKVTLSDNKILKLPSDGYLLGRIGDSIA